MPANHVSRTAVVVNVRMMIKIAGFEKNYYLCISLKNKIMETLKEKISADYVAAFKSREKVKKNLLGVLKTEITKLETAPKASAITDEGVSKAIKSLTKGVKDILAVSPENEEAKLELSILESYLPKQMSEEEIRTEVAKVITETGAASPSEMSKVMGGFNAKYTGKADGKTVSLIVKELLNKS